MKELPSLVDALDQYNAAAETLEEKRNQLLKVASKLKELQLAKKILNNLLRTIYR